MLSPIAVILLAAYSFVLVASYLLVRRGWIRAYPTFVVGFVANALILFAFSLVRGNAFFHALMVGLSMGIIFSGLSVTLAFIFRYSTPLENKAFGTSSPTVVMEHSQAHHSPA